MMADKSAKKRKLFRSNKQNVKHIIVNRKKKKQSEINEEIQSLSHQYSELQHVGLLDLNLAFVGNPLKIAEEFGVKSESLENFPDFPLSSKTKQGLQYGKFKKPTDIQKQSLLLSLQGNDILGAAKTGSGKTLAFLIPVLEILYREKWSQLDGLGALIISPTRELAFQTFEVLKIVGKFHDFSAGLVIGGKHLREEAERINRTNIVICTPGRLLQHMDQTVNFHADNLQILVLDEADRILDLGFQESMNAIIQNLPVKRQTLLFSATQTKSVKDLARLSLKNPMYISVHENAKHSTPTQLQQSFIVCELHEKLDILWSFVRNHIKKKILVFLSSCKQVRFVYEVFRKLRPGNTVLCLHGAMQQMKRVATYEAFCRKQHAVLFATDIAARGLDFPAVHWVIQMDCPEDANTYIHRVGRTARYEQNGEALLVLVPSEEKAMLKQLGDKKIPVERIRVNPKKMGSIQRKLESLCASEIQIKEFAKRAFMSYLKAVYFMKNKAVFNIKDLDTEKYACSLGLAIPPRIRFLQRELQRQKQTQAQSEKSLLVGKFKVDKRQDVDSAETSGLGSDSNTSDENDSQSETGSSDGSVKQGLGVDWNRDDVSQKKTLTKVTKQQMNSESESEYSESENESLESDIESPGDNRSDVLTLQSGKGSKEVSRMSEKLKDGGVKKEKVGQKRNNKEDEERKGMLFSSGEEDEGIDNLLVVKKKHIRNIKGAESSDEDKDVFDSVQKKNKKAATKAALAKKIIKKKLKVNTKVLFDEEGQEVRDVMKKSTLSSDEDDDLIGGISIEEAKKRMQQEDQVDRQIYRERIKEKHKEKRLKEKEKRRAEAERRKQRNLEQGQPVLAGSSDRDSDASFHSEDEDSLGDSTDNDQSGDGQSDTDDSTSAEEGFAGMEESDSEDQSDNDEIQEVIQMTERSSSRKRKGGETHKYLKKKRTDEEFNTGLSLIDDEEIALKLLQN